MKLRKGDKVIVISGRDKGKTGEVLVAMPAENKVVVAGVNQVKRHTKPSQKEPKGGIITVDKPIDVSKLAAIDPSSGKPARIGYKVTEKGEKTRIYKVAKFSNKKAAKPAAKAATTKTKEVSK